MLLTLLVTWLALAAVVWCFGAISGRADRRIKAMQHARDGLGEGDGIDVHVAAANSTAARPASEMNKLEFGA